MDKKVSTWWSDWRNIGETVEKDECVHHIDGNPQNNDKKNLVCCTLKGHSEIHHPKRFFSKHPVLKRRIRLRKFHVPKEILEKLVWEKPTEKVAKIFGVSGKAIEKRCKLLGIVKPPRGYWRKVETSTLCWRFESFCLYQGCCGYGSTGRTTAFQAVDESSSLSTRSTRSWPALSKT